MAKDSSDIIDQYKSNYNVFDECKEKVRNLVEILLKENKIAVHSIDSRTKKEESLKGKISKNIGKYKSLDDITDIAGIRIITYFANDVDKVASLIEKEFTIDKENSIDKRQLLDPDRFGYLSLHYVVSLNDYRKDMIEYRRFSNCKVEIQIRSILQHTWAEIEHDLGYKTKQSVPKDIRRRFSRIAGLLELADDEFIKIRNDLKDYEGNVNKLIENSPESVLIDQASLKSFIENNKLMINLNNSIANISKSQMVTPDLFKSDDIKILKYLKINTIKELMDNLKEYEKVILELAQRWLTDEGDYYGTLSAFLPIYYMGFAYVGCKYDYTEILEYLTVHSIEMEEERDNLAGEIIDVCKEVMYR